MRGRRGIATLVGLVALLSGSRAAAQTASSDAAELFRQGRAALEAKEYVTACSKLAESLRLERAVGTLISLAECEQASNKLAAARQHWQEAADLADAVSDPLHRGPYAREQFTRIDARVPRVTVHLAPGAPRDARLERDGVDLGSSAFDSPLPIDPGTHRLVLTATGHTSRIATVEAREGQTQDLMLDVGPEEANAPTASAGVVAVASTGGGQRTLAYVLGGVGAAGLAAGAVFGLVAGSKWSEAKDTCGVTCPPTSPAVSQRSSAESFATGSDIAFAVGGAALAAGLVLLITAPRPGEPARAAWMVAPLPGGLVLVGGM